jgi:pyrimidine operon attenuation protein / uracil phosphoribosyltransferase
MILLDQNRIERTLKRMAYQILEEAQNSQITLLGLNNRGHALGKIIRDNLRDEVEQEIILHKLTVDEHSPLNIPARQTDNQILVIVDDVIFSGETMFKAIRNVSELSAFKKILVAVLIDRGHRKYPVLAGIVGMDVPTKLNEQVELQFDKNEPIRVVLIEK